MLSHKLFAILLSSLILLSSSAFGHQELAEVRKKINIPNAFSGTFEQSKSFHDLPFPIVSSGQFHFSSTSGLHWEIHSPIESKLTITKSELVQYEGDREIFRLDGKEEPSAALILQLFYAVFSGNWEMLSAHFVPKVSFSSNFWRIKLLPKSEPLSSFASELELAGSTHLDKFSISEISGDKTVIVFSNVTSE